ncbi:MAG: transporter substrate-binding domain-containing protein [Burkholderiales bacterium]
MKARLFATTLLALAAASAQAQAIQGVTEFSSYTYLQDGRVAGPATEIVESSLRGAGLADYRLGVYPWARAYDMAQKEPNVLIFLIARTPAREALFKWVGEFMTIEYHFYKLKARKDIVVKSLDDARQYTIGVTRDDIRHQYLQAKGFTRLVVSGENLEKFRKLVNGQVQLTPFPATDVAALCKEAKFDCDQLERAHPLEGLSMSLYMAYSAATTDATVARTRAAFDRLRADGTVKRLMTPPNAARP